MSRFQELLVDHTEDELREALLLSPSVEIAPQGKVPAISYTPDIYEREKRQGIRRANGARKLKKLTNKHLRIISMHLRGHSGESIAASIGCTFITVSRILNDPLALDLLKLVYKDRQGEIDALAGQAINAVREGLDSTMSMRIRLTAVDKLTKLKDSIGKEGESEKTAEDIVREIFKKIEINDSQVQINIGGKND